MMLQQNCLRLIKRNNSIVIVHATFIAWVKMFFKISDLKNTKYKTSCCTAVSVCK